MEGCVRKGNLETFYNSNWLVVNNSWPQSDLVTPNKTSHNNKKKIYIIHIYKDKIYYMEIIFSY